MKCVMCSSDIGAYGPFHGDLLCQNCMEDKKDKINPSHYKKGGIETIAFIKAKMSDEQFKGYLLGNVFKYTSRFQDKNGLEDLRKAQWYLNKLIEVSV